jgi:hypothetical protein
VNHPLWQIHTGDDGASQFWVVETDGRLEFAPRRLGMYLCSEAPMAIGGGCLYRFVRGRYQPDGESWARSRIADLLGDHWRSSYANSTMVWLRDTAPALPEE